MKDFAQKIAVVTGAASGIGRALGEKFAEAGCNLVLADMDDAGLDESRSLIEKRGVKVETVHCDVSRQDSVDALADASYQAFGAVPLIFPNRESLFDHGARQTVQLAAPLGHFGPDCAA